MSSPLTLYYRPGLLIVWLLLLLGGCIVLGAATLEQIQGGAWPIPLIIFFAFALIGLLYIFNRLLNRSKPALVADAAGLSYLRGAKYAAWSDVSNITVRKEMMITYMRLHFASTDGSSAPRFAEICLSGLSLAPADIAARVKAFKDKSGKPLSD